MTKWRSETLKGPKDLGPVDFGILLAWMKPEEGLRKLGKKRKRDPGRGGKG